jgi:hypothetical protein
MKIINLLICKLYDNFVYKNVRPSVSQYILAKISVSMILLYWLFVIIECFTMSMIKGIEIPLTWLYILLFFVCFYFIKKNTWSISQVEEFVKDKENEKILNGMIWIFWITLILPTIFFVLYVKK